MKCWLLTTPLMSGCSFPTRPLVPAQAWGLSRRAQPAPRPAPAVAWLLLPRVPKPLLCLSLLNHIASNPPSAFDVPAMNFNCPPVSPRAWFGRRLPCDNSSAFTTFDRFSFSFPLHSFFFLFVSVFRCCGHAGIVTDNTLTAEPGEGGTGGPPGPSGWFC